LTFSIDSFLADIWDQYATQYFDPVPTAVHRYYAESQSQGNSFIPFQSLAVYRTTARAQLIYSVWRLDGPTVAVANAQVDGATAAMAAGGPPVSQVLGSPSNACVDMKESTSGIPDSGLYSIDWDLYRASQILTAANKFSVITDMLPTQFGTSPSPNCPNSGFYVGWYNYGSYNSAFSWDQGSIGWDIDSGALADTRNPPWWGAGAIANGISVTSGPVTEPFTAGIVKPAVIRNLFEGANVGDAFLRNTHWLKWMTVNVGDPLYQPFPGGVAPFNPPGGANSMPAFINQSTFRQYVGGNPVAVSISVATPAPSTGLTFALSTNMAGLNIPSSITIPSGQTSVIVAGSATTVTAEADVQLTATAGSISATNTLSVFPLLSGIVFANSPTTGGGTVTLSGGQTVQEELYLNSNAPIGGVVIQLSSDTPSVVSVPASVTVGQGLAQAPFSLTTSNVSANTLVNVTSSYAGATNTVQITVTP
jgi:uncharacterized protein (TIGR03790 family)